MLAAFNVTAQVDGFQLPYNPDSEPDGYIGVGDVLELLVMFGQTFTPDGIYVNDDSTHVLMDMGSMTYPECEYTCQFALPGFWRVSTLADLGAAWETAQAEEAWISMKDVQLHGLQVSYITTAYADEVANGTQTTPQLNANHSCFCATHERPKVEYSYCYGDALNGIQGCCDEKVQDGWYPLGSLINSNPYAAENHTRLSQAFWRWAD